MNGFVSNILLRHTQPSENVQPRIRSRFEPDANAGAISSKNSFTEEQFMSDENPHSAVTKHFSGDENASSISNTASSLINQNNPSASSFHEKKNDSPVTLKDASFDGDTANRTDDKFQEKEQNFLKENLPLSLTHLDKTLLREVFEQNNDSSVSKLQARDDVEEINADGKRTNAKNEPEAGFLTVEESTLTSPFLGEKKSASLFNNGTQSDRGFLNERNSSFAMSAHLQELGNFRSPSLHQLNEPTQQVIKVTIGRVEVRANVQKEPAPSKSQPAAKPKLSLDDYLKQRNNTSK